MPEILSPVYMQWWVKIPMRDGVTLNATLYLPKHQGAPSPAVFTLTPYIAQKYHDAGMDFAAHGYPFLAIDVRGRGNSEGEFWPFNNDAQDGYDIVEWLAQQSYCNGQVTMWGGSYCGWDQWATAKEFPPNLATIVPRASPYIGVDFPIIDGNFNVPYTMQWLTLVSGDTSQEMLFESALFWGTKFREWFEAGVPFKELDAFLGNPSEIFQTWLSHPRQDSYWDSFNPTGEQYAKLSIPILTITGCYDSDQPGALTHYREYMKHTSEEGRTRHYLVIGPWDHPGTRSPQAEFLGLNVGSASLLDIHHLQRQWCAWTMQGGSKPEFLQNYVAYYVMGEERWRYADSLEAITAHIAPLFLHATDNPTDLFHSGSLIEQPVQSRPDHYVYDPRDINHAELESTIHPDWLTDQRLLYVLVGKQLIYHSDPFAQETEISGFFSLTVWLSIDQPDTDFRASVYDTGIDGSSVLLSRASIRARYRESLRKERLIHTQEPLEYRFDQFPFISRTIKRGNRLRLVIGPINSIYSEKNYNTGGVVAEESMSAARTVTVKLFHDASHPSALYVPYGRPNTKILHAP